MYERERHCSSLCDTILRLKRSHFISFNIKTELDTTLWESQRNSQNNERKGKNRQANGDIFVEAFVDKRSIISTVLILNSALSMLVNVSEKNVSS